MNTYTVAFVSLPSAKESKSVKVEAESGTDAENKALKIVGLGWQVHTVLKH